MTHHTHVMVSKAFDKHMCDVNVCLCFFQRVQEEDEVVYAGVVMRR